MKINLLDLNVFLRKSVQGCVRKHFIKKNIENLTGLLDKAGQSALKLASRTPKPYSFSPAIIAHRNVLLHSNNTCESLMTSIT